MEIMSNKATLRSQLLAARSALTAEAQASASAAIAGHVLAWWQANPVPVLGVYWPMRKEPDLRAAYEELGAHGVQLALPVVDGRDSPLRFIAWSPGAALRKDAMGVSVPEDQSLQVRPDALLIPCLGFTAQRLRLGYGGGFYDRTLAAAPRMQSVGIAYAAAAVEFEAEPFDVALGRIITERG